MSDATTRRILRSLRQLRIAVAMARRNKVGAWNALDNGVESGPFAVDDQSAALENIIERLKNTGHGGKLWLPSQVYTVDDGFTIPENLAAVVEGEGSGWRSSFGRGTTLKRRANPSVAEAPMIQSNGTGSTDSQRAIPRLKGLRLDGGTGGGVTDGWGLLLQRIQEGAPLIEDVRLENFPGRAAQINQVYNSSIDHFRVTHSGSSTLDSLGEPQEAVRLGGTNDGGTVTLNGYDWQFEQNNWTDLRIGGADGFSNGFVTEFNLFGAKFEGGLGVAAPYIHYAFCELSNLYGIGIFCHRSVPPILVTHSVTGEGEDAPVHHHGWIAQAPSVTAPDYFIDVQGGNLHYHGTIRGTPGIAHVRIGANVRPGNFTFEGQVYDFNGTTSTPADLIVEDNRSNPEF